jgi:hypothetical protein
MKEIPLTQGKVALVDDEDFSELSKHVWCAHKVGYHYYAARRTDTGNILHMHRAIMKPPEGLIVDHISGDGLDNRKNNLRNCTYSQNLRGHRKENGFRGVSFFKRDCNYSVGITVNGKRVHVGYYKTAIEAAKAYNKASIKYNGNDGFLNTIPEGE